MGSVLSFVRRATRQDELRVAARMGYLITGTLHVLIASIIVQIAMGGRGDADPSGALATVAASPGGVIALWIIAVALVPLALWRLAESLIGLHPGEGHHGTREDRSTANRLKAFGLLLVYCGVALTAVRFALGRGEASSRQNAGFSARLIQHPWGRGALIVAGLVIVVVGAYFAYKGASRRFIHDLTDPPGPLVSTLGVFGYVAEGLVLSLAGLLVIVASVNSEPAKAAGLDAAVKTLAETSSGRVVLLFAAAGFAAFGAYSFASSRLARM